MTSYNLGIIITCLYCKHINAKPMNEEPNPDQTHATAAVATAASAKDENFSGIYEKF